VKYEFEDFARLNLGTLLFRDDAASLGKESDAASLANRIALSRDTLPYARRMEFRDAVL